VEKIMYDKGAHERVASHNDAVKPSRHPETALRPIVFVLDGNQLARRSLEVLIHSAGWDAMVFASAGEFFMRPRTAGPSCLVVDALLPDSSGLEVQERLSRDDVAVSTILTMAHPDVPVTVRAMKAGAVEVLHKPVAPTVLRDAIGEALKRSRERLDARSSLIALRACYASLSTREREVMSLIVAGLLNKQVGGELGISEYTVKAHRGQVMRKMEARSFADLVSKAALLARAPH
jgi:FixJ family two-component response regulator